MRLILLSSLIAIAGACAGSDKGSDTNITKNVQVEEDKATSDGLVTTCAEEIGLVCAEGSVDGCSVTSDAGDSLTLSHICVPEAETFAAPSCEQEIARVCGEGLVDACLLSPAASTLHVCVAQSAADEGGEDVEDVEDVEDADATEQE